jgi:GDP/UDP-N,N'-diacetylbacillosamine 2-epimerase (hydrolysing)
MSKRKVCVITGTRSEYGLLYPVLKKIKNSTSLDLQLVVTSMHLSMEFGLTYQQIEKDGFIINDKIENLLSSDSTSSVAKSTGLAMILLSDTLNRLQPDLVLLLGDRYETHAAATTAMLMTIPIAHIHGGEISAGAIDEQIRHSITKMAQLHFTSTQSYRQRIIQMGENPMKVFNTGAPGIDNIANLKLLSKDKLEQKFGWYFGTKNALFTYHPVTLAQENLTRDMDMMLNILADTELNIIFSYANADFNGRLINQKLEAFCHLNKKKYKLIKNMGQRIYLSVMNQVDLLIGNSSSGIIESATCKKPVINIGKRQKGRLQSGNVIDSDIGSLGDSITHALSASFISKCQKINNIYGDGSAAESIVNILQSEKFCCQKEFVDIKKTS